MKRDSLRNQNIEVKTEPGLSDTATIQNPQTDSFSSFKTTTKGTNMLAEISQPSLGVAELRNLGRSLGISETLSPDIRDQILRKAFDGKWTLDKLKKKAASMTSHEEFRKRKDKQNDKIITKLALENKVLKKENKEVKKTMNVIQKQVAKQDLKIEVVHEKVVENTQHIVNVSSELGVVSTKVDGIEVKLENISSNMNILVEQTINLQKTLDQSIVRSIESSKNVGENSKSMTKLSKIVKKVAKIKKSKKKSTAQNDSDNMTVTFSNDEPKRRKYSETNSTSINRITSPERQVETPDNRRSRARRNSPARNPVRRENGDDRRSTKSSLPRNRSPRNRSLRSRSPTIHSGHNRSTCSRSPSRSNRKTSSKKNSKSMNSHDFNLNYDVASRKERSQVREKRSSSNWQSLPDEKEVSSKISKSQDEVVISDVISDSHSNFPSGDELDNVNSSTPEKQVWHHEENDSICDFNNNLFEETCRK